MTATVVIWTDAKVHDSVDVPDPVTLLGVTVHATLLAVRLTTPLKPWTADTVIVEVPATPVFKLTVVGMAVIVKSWMVMFVAPLLERWIGSPG